MQVQYTDDTTGEVKTRQATAEEAILPTAEELAQIDSIKEEMVDDYKRIAFQKEADPLFFKAQRGEATMEEWLTKVEEIKSRFVS